MVEVLDQTFNLEVLNFPGPVVFVIHAPWCGHCRTLLPVLDQLAFQYAGRVKFAKMDIDQNAAIPSQYGVRGVPALFFFKGRQLVHRLVGSQPREEIERQLLSLL
jgi:thioredoxin 1